MRKSRQRRREGLTEVRIVVRREPLIEMLLDRGFLQEWDEADRSKIADAAARFLAACYR